MVLNCSDLGDTQLEVKIVLPWKDEVKLEYHIVAVGVTGLCKIRAVIIVVVFYSLGLSAKQSKL